MSTSIFNGAQLDRRPSNPGVEPSHVFAEPAPLAEHAARKGRADASTSSSEPNDSDDDLEWYMASSSRTSRQRHSDTIDREADNRRASSDKASGDVRLQSNSLRQEVRKANEPAS